MVNSGRRQILAALATAGGFTLTGCQQLTSDETPVTTTQADTSSPTKSATAPSGSTRRFTATIMTWTPDLTNKPLWVVGQPQQELLIDANNTQSYQSTFAQQYIADPTTLGSTPNPFPHNELEAVQFNTDQPLRLFNSPAAEYTLWYETPETTPSEVHQLSTFDRPERELIRSLLSTTNPGQANQLTQLSPFGPSEQIDNKSIMIDDTTYSFRAYPTKTPEYPPTTISISAWPVEIEGEPIQLMTEPPLSHAQAERLLTDELKLSSDSTLASKLRDEHPYILSPTALWRVNSH